MEHLERLIQDCRRHDRKAQRVLYEQYRAYALKVAFRYLYHYEEAADAVNDGFVKLFSKLEQFDYSEAIDTQQLFMGWMRRIMINTSIDRLRKKSLLPEIGAMPDEIWDVKDDSADADQALLYKDLIVQIKRLPPTYRIVFNMYVIDGYTHSEIADKLGMSVGTSKSNLSRARALLQQYVRKMEEAIVCSI